MRVHPFKGQPETPGQPMLPGEFIMDFPCIVGRSHYVGEGAANRRLRYRYAEFKPFELNMRSERAKATSIPDRESLARILAVLAMLGGTDGVFVEPKEEK